MAQRKDVRLRPGHTTNTDIYLTSDGASWQDVTLSPGSASTITLTGGGSIVDNPAPSGPGSQEVELVGLGSAQAFGTITITAGGTTVAITGLGSAQSFGTVTPTGGNADVAITGLGSAQAFGSPEFNFTIYLTGLGSAQAFGVVSPVRESVGGVVGDESNIGHGRWYL